MINDTCGDLGKGHFWCGGGPHLVCSVALLVELEHTAGPGALNHCLLFVKRHFSKGVSPGRDVFLGLTAGALMSPTSGVLHRLYVHAGKVPAGNISKFSFFPRSKFIPQLSAAGTMMGGGCPARPSCLSPATHSLWA